MQLDYFTLVCINQNATNYYLEVICLFLDGDRWSTTGMTVGSIEEEYIECLTNHLSSFTMVVLELSESDNVALKFITYIGSGLSLAGLFITCVVYIVLYKDLQILTTSRHLVHLNLQIALGLTQLVFLAGGSATSNEIICKVIAILVHYFSLAGFTWILLEVVMLYLKLIAVYDGEFVRMKNFLLFGWGFPLLLVGLFAGVNIDAYGNEQWCWLSNKDDGFLWIFHAPVIIITSVTLVAVIAVVRVLCVASKSEAADAKKRI
ncbi:adhesion G- coupled receptor D1-like isoform X2, partial [Paramuricea clavata]